MNSRGKLHGPLDSKHSHYMFERCCFGASAVVARLDGNDPSRYGNDDPECKLNRFAEHRSERPQSNIGRLHDEFRG